MTSPPKGRPLRCVSYTSQLGLLWEPRLIYPSLPWDLSFVSSKLWKFRPFEVHPKLSSKKKTSAWSYSWIFKKITYHAGPQFFTVRWRQAGPKNSGTADETKNGTFCSSFCCYSCLEGQNLGGYRTIEGKKSSILTQKMACRKLWRNESPPEKNIKRTQNTFIKRGHYHLLQAFKQKCLYVHKTTLICTQGFNKKILP